MPPETSQTTPNVPFGSDLTKKRFLVGSAIVIIIIALALVAGILFKNRESTKTLSETEQLELLNKLSTDSKEADLSVAERQKLLDAVTPENSDAVLSAEEQLKLLESLEKK